MSEVDDDPGPDHELEEIAEILTATLTEIREQVRRIREELVQGDGGGEKREPG